MKLGVYGTGIMGKGVALAAAGAGLEVVLVRATGSDTAGVKKALEESVQKEVEKGKRSQEDAEMLISRLSYGQGPEDFSSCELVLESVVEDRTVKQEAFRKLEAHLKNGALLATNTSTLSITELMLSLKRKDRFLGLHFFNPANVMKLVEVIPTLETSEATVRIAFDFAKRIGKEPVLVQDRTGFVVNRLLVPYLLDAIRAVESGTAKMADVDRAMMTGCNHPMGPFALMDWIGLDIVAAMAQNLYEEYGEERLAPHPVLKRLLLAGHLGRKSGLGFYDYKEKPPTPNPKAFGFRSNHD